MTPRVRDLERDLKERDLKERDPERETQRERPRERDPERAREPETQRERESRVMVLFTWQVCQRWSATRSISDRT